MKSYQVKTPHERTLGKAKQVMVHCPKASGVNPKASLTPAHE
jgi:hypothetical protein